MSKPVLHTIVLCLLMLCPLYVWADRKGETQNIDAMYSAGTLTISPNNLTGTTDFVTYTCSGTSAAFGVSSTKVAILLPKSGSTVTTSRISNLVGLEIVHNPYAACSYIKVYVSVDNSNWTLVTTEDSYKTGYIDIPSFARDNYYVKITSTTTSAFAVRSIIYYTEDCNCFRYVPE